MINLAIALSFVVAGLFWPGGRALQLLIELPVLHSLPQYQAHLLLAFANYCIPAVLFYVLLRLTRAGEWLRSRGWIQFLLGAANILFILYVSAKIVASEVEGGGASFVVVSFAPVVLLPATAMALAGLTWLTVRSVRMRSLPPQSAATPLNGRTATALVATLVIPGAALVFPIFVARDAPFRLAAEARAVMREQCSRSGEVILVIGTLTYFVSKRGKRICGHSGGDRLEVREFIKKTLNLRKPPITP